jgi:hypothetical protein
MSNKWIATNLTKTSRLRASDEEAKGDRRSSGGRMSEAAVAA